MGSRENQKRLKCFFRNLSRAAILAAIVLSCMLLMTMDAEAKEIDDSTNAVASYTANGTVKYYDDLKSAIDAANADSADGKTRGVVKLLQDYKQSVVRDATLSGEDARNESEYKTSLVMEGTYTLDLNGKSINCESIGGGGWNGLSVLFVKSGKISLINSDSDHPGQINPVKS